MKEFRADKSEVGQAPLTPGIYKFLDKQGQVLYVGKAKNLRSRLNSYFSKAVEGKTKIMVSEAKNISVVPVDSEFEALLLEAKLIKKYKPPFNIELKDDKSPIYIGITRERYPRVLTFRQTQLKKVKLKHVYGPFESARSAKRVLKILRKTFPFSTHKVGKRACLYKEIGLCDPCPSEIENLLEPEKAKARKKYLENTKYINRVLKGELKKVRIDLTQKMETYSDKQEFESAKKVLQKISFLDAVTASPKSIDPYIDDPNFLTEVRKREKKELSKIVNQYLHVDSLVRIECFDIAHLAGTFPTASMVTFVDGEPDKNYYRHFRIKNKKGNSDFDSMSEVIKRRSKHFTDWGKPDLVLIDGGKPQVKAAADELDEDIPVVGIAKRYETLVFITESGFEQVRLHRGPALNLVQRLRDEAHRFARRYHHKLVSKAIKEKK